MIPLNSATEDAYLSAILAAQEADPEIEHPMVVRAVAGRLAVEEILDHLLAFASVSNFQGLVAEIADLSEFAT